jgi:hypothetical protein
MQAPALPAGAPAAVAMQASLGRWIARLLPTEDVLCQPPTEIVDAGLLSSAGRSARWAALWVTAVPAIRWVAARSGRGPDGVGMVTVMCCCSPVWRWGS